MSFQTENSAEMARKRGRGRPPKPQPEIVEAAVEQLTTAAPAAQPQPEERLIPLTLKRGWWPMDGTVYIIEDAYGQPHRKNYKTPHTSTGEVDEMARKRDKFLPGTRIQVPVHIAKTLIDAGKADLDTSL